MQGNEFNEFDKSQDTSKDNSNDKKRYIKASACCKHFAVYNLEGFDRKGQARLRFNAITNEYDLNETYFVPFKYCIQEAKVSSLMCSYNAINGIPACGNSWLMTNVARKQMKFDGYITSDCGAVTHMIDKHKYTHNDIENINTVYQAGMDIECGDFTFNYGLDAEKQAKIEGTESIDIDSMKQSLYRAALVQFRLGLFDPNSFIPWSELDASSILSAQHKKLALEATQQSIVLLKNNDNFLPLDSKQLNLNQGNPGKTKIALIGPNGINTKVMRGNYFGQAPFMFNIKKGLETYLNEQNIDNNIAITFESGCESVECEQLDQDLLRLTVHVAAESVLTILAVGLDDTIEGEFQDRKSLELPGKQYEMIEQVIKASKHVILIVLSGGCVDVERFISNPKVDAMIWQGYGGMYGGYGIAQVIFGEFSPVGRLTQTWYKQEYVNHVDMEDVGLRPNNNNLGRGYRFYNGSYINFEFGYGLSYTTFECSDIEILNKNQLKIEIKNTGKVSSGGNVLVFWVPKNNQDENGYFLLKRLVAFESFWSLGAGHNVTLLMDFYGEFNSDHNSVELGSYDVGGVCQ